MAIRVAGIDLTEVQIVASSEARHWIEHRLPGAPGGVVQDLGPQLMALELEGLLRGDDAAGALSALRTAYTEGAPVPLAADLLAGTTVTEVLVADLSVQQIAGYKQRYHYRMALREYIEPPAPPQKALDALQSGIAADAAAWAESALLAADGDLFAQRAIERILGDPAGAGQVLIEVHDHDEEPIDDVLAGTAPEIAADPALLAALLSAEDLAMVAELLAAVGTALAREPEQLAAACAEVDGARLLEASALLSGLGAEIMAEDAALLAGAITALQGLEGAAVDAVLTGISRAIALDTEAAIELLTGAGAVLLDHVRFKEIVAGELVMALDEVDPYRERVASKPGGEPLAAELAEAQYTTIEGSFPGVWEPMEVQLLTLDNRLVDVVLTDGEGNFVFEQVKPGEYFLSLSGMWFETDEEVEA